MSQSDDISAEMQQIWQRLESWLQAELPEVHLHQGATEAQIRNAETEMEVQLPSEFKEFYRVHDGQQDTGNGIIFSCTLLPLEQILQQWRKWVDVAKDFGDDNEDEDMYGSIPEDHVKSWYTNAKWIPFTFDWGGNHIGIDFDPAPKGRSGQIIAFGRDDDYKYVYGQSFKEFIEGIVAELEAGNYVITADRVLDMDVYHRHLRHTADTVCP